MSVSDLESQTFSRNSRLLIKDTDSIFRGFIYAPDTIFSIDCCYTKRIDVMKSQKWRNATIIDTPCPLFQGKENVKY